MALGAHEESGRVVDRQVAIFTSRDLLHERGHFLRRIVISVGAAAEKARDFKARVSRIVRDPVAAEEFLPGKWGKMEDIKGRFRLVRLAVRQAVRHGTAMVI